MDSPEDQLREVEGGLLRGHAEQNQVHHEKEQKRSLSGMLVFSLIAFCYVASLENKASSSLDEPLTFLGVGKLVIG